MDPAPEPLARRVARWLPPVGLVAFLVLCMWHLDTVAAWLQWMDEQGPAGDAVFVAFYLLATVATLASWILEGGAGFLYGPVLGVPIAVGLGTIGATCGFGL